MCTTAFELKPFMQKVPPNLEQAFGYFGDRQWISFFWSKDNDSFFIYDGNLINTVSYISWGSFFEHPFVVAMNQRTNDANNRYEFGDFYKEAKHWTVLDRNERKLYVGWRCDVLKFIKAMTRNKAEKRELVETQWIESSFGQGLHLIDLMVQWLDEQYDCQMEKPEPQYQRQWPNAYKKPFGSFQ